MKKIYLSLGLGLLILGANAQQKIVKKLTAHAATTPVTVSNTASRALSTTTLMPSTFSGSGCATNTANIVYYSIAQYTATPSYTADARGFAFGTNVTYVTQAGVTYTITDSKIAEKYTVAGTATISNVVMGSAIHKSNAATSMVNAKIYSQNATTKAPNAQIGGTSSKALNSLTGNDAFAFSTPVVVPAGNFFVVIESPALGGATKDTLAIFSTAEGCSTTDSLSWQYTLQTAPTGSVGAWESIAAGDNTYNLDYLVFPVADIAASTTGINSVSKGDLTLLAAFPNPASSEVNINFGLNQSAKTEINVYDVTGKLILTSKLDELEAGNHTVKLDVSSLNAGVYMYSVKSNNAQLFSKFTVVK